MSLPLTQMLYKFLSDFPDKVSITIAILLSVSGCKSFSSGSEASTLMDGNPVYEDNYDHIDPEYMSWSTIYAYPNGVLQGQPVTLYWHAPLASRVEINGIPGNFPGRFGSTIVYPQGSQDYTLTAYNSRTTITGLIHVEVFPYPGAVTSFWGEPAAITPGNPAVLRWRAQNCDYVEIRDDASATPLYTGRCVIEDSFRVQPQVRTRYTVTAFRNYSGPGTAGGNIATNIPLTIVGRSDTVIDIVDKVPEISLTASSYTAREGQQIYINWTVQDGENITFDPPVVSNPGPSGSTSFVATQTTTYRLVAYSRVNRQRHEKSVKVEVLPKFRINQLIVRPEILQKGDVGSIVWSTSQCRRVWVTKVSGEKVSLDLNCNNALEIRPTESSQYIVHFEYEDETSTNLKIQEIPVQVTVVGGPDIAIPISAPDVAPPAPMLPATPSPVPQDRPLASAAPTPVRSGQSTPRAEAVAPGPVVVADRREAPRIVFLNANKYSTWSDEPIVLHWKAIRAKRVILRAGGQTYTLSPKGQKELRLKKTEKISLVAENDKYRTNPTEIEINVGDRELMNMLFDAVYKQGTKQ